MDCITQMAKRHSVNNVKIVSFPDVCQYIRGLTYNKAQEVDMNATGAHKVLRANNITLGSNTLNFEDVKCVVKEVVVKDTQWLKNGDILMCASSGSQEHVGKVAFISEDLDYTFGGFMAVIRCKEEVLPRYMFHVLTSDLFTGHLKDTLKSNTIKTINAAAMNAFSFPLPAMEVQEEIVRILDEYSEKNAQLIDALKVELEARKTQYEYYREKLFAAKDEVMLPLEEIAEIGTGSSNTNEATEDGGYPFYVRSPEVLKKADYEFDEEAIITAGDGVGVGKVFHFVKGKYALHQRAYRIHITDSRVLPEFFYYYMKATFYPYINNAKYVGAVSSIRRPMLNAYPVPILSIDEQMKIVIACQDYDEACLSLCANIEDEIRLRQTQYAYYRNKLLAFQEAN